MTKDGIKRGRYMNLSVFYTNSRSVINKIDTLRGIACVEELDIVVSAKSIGSFKRWLGQSMDRDDRWDG